MVVLVHVVAVVFKIIGYSGPVEPKPRLGQNGRELPSWDFFSDPPE